MKTWLQNILKLFMPIVKANELITEPVDINKLTVLCKTEEMSELLKLLKRERDNIMRLEMSSPNNDKTSLRKGEIIAYDMIIANISEVRKEEIVYARKSEGSNSK